MQVVVASVRSPLGTLVHHRHRRIVEALADGTRRQFAISRCPTGDREAIDDEQARPLQAL